ncbi:hypothetical protein [Lysinibacillus capsici]|uniref:hypothetical protein n=1 Tax=Lysinibacillus capsici TaxID=2115968 RepID=UPI0021536459|nr:hypothetical protein [Lysinibacillus capsici]MCR6525380.1 hypothetical protein [Lysinibacillus capsici]
MEKNNRGCYDCFEDYLKKFEVSIRRALYQTPLSEREDLKQELHIKIFEKTRNIDFREEAPSFWSVLEKMC